MSIINKHSYFGEEDTHRGPGPTSALVACDGVAMQPARNTPRACAFTASASPRSPMRARYNDGDQAFRPACWPPEEGELDGPGASQNSGASPAEETLLRWQAQVAGLDGIRTGVRVSPEKREVGLHRVRCTSDDASDSSDEDHQPDVLTSAHRASSPESSTLKTSTTISKVVDYIGKRMQEVHAEMQTPRGHPSGYDDPEHVQQQVVYPPKTPRQDLFPAEPLGSGISIISSSSGSGSVSASACSGIQTTRQQAPKSDCTFLFARVVSNADDHLSKPETKKEESTEDVDQNAVVEWWSNLIRFRPGAPSKQAALIRETHDRLSQMLTRKEERMDELYEQNVELERGIKAAEVLARGMISELEAVRVAFTYFCDAENLNWTTQGREGSKLRALHMQELSNLRKSLGETHAKEIADLACKLKEESVLKEEALTKVQQLLQESSSLEKKNIENTDRLLADLRAKDTELDKMHATLAQKDSELKLLNQRREAEMDKMQTLLDHKENEIKMFQQQKGTEMKLLSAEHLSALKSKDAELRHELEALSKLKLAEMDAAVVKHLSELRAKEEAHESLMRKKDKQLEELDSKCKSELDAMEKKRKAAEDDLFAQLRAEQTKNADLSSKLKAADDLSRKTLAEKEETIKELKGNLQESKQEIERLMSEILKEKERRKTAQENSDKRIQGMEDMARELERRLGVSENESAAEIARLRAEIERLKSMLEQEREKRRELEVKQKDIEGTTREWERRLAASEKESASEIARLRSEVERLKEENERLKGMLDQERAKGGEFQSKLRALEEARRELESKLRLAEEAIKRAKLTGIGMRITDEAPHRITEIVQHGAAYMSGALEVGDYILEVAQMEADKYPIDEIRNFILGPVGSYLELKLDRRDENNESNVFTVKIKRSALDTSGLDTAHIERRSSRPLSGGNWTRPGFSQTFTGREYTAEPEVGVQQQAVKKKKASTSFFGPGPLF